MTDQQPPPRRHHAWRIARRTLAKSWDDSIFSESAQAGFWSVQAGIFPENTGSIRLHESCGFRPVGTFIRQGKMNHGPMTGEWRDVFYMQWRSRRVGVD